MHKIILLTVLSALLFYSCETDKQSNKLSVMVSIEPQKYFVEKIAGDKADISVFVPAGMSPATYEPLPKQMITMNDADVYFRIGVPFERSWISKIENNFPNLKIADTRNGIKLREIDVFEIEEEEDGHGHGHEGHSHEGGKDPHIWLSPKLVKVQAKVILNTMVELDPENAEYFKENFEKFSASLDSLSDKVAGILSALKDTTFMVFHPSWGYFADEFGLKQVAVEIEGKEPSASSLTKIIRFARDNKINKIFVQEQFASNALEAIAKETGAKTGKINPLAYDYENNLIETAKKIAGKYE